VIRAFGGLESIELHNNVFVGAGGAFILVRTVEAEWRAGQSISGSRNWIQAGSTVPTGLQHTILGSDAGLVNLAASDLRPEAGSPLIDAGTSAPASASGHPFPQPLFPPQAHPPARQVEDGVPARPLVGPIDIGAFEFGAPPLLDERTMLPLTLR